MNFFFPNQIKEHPSKEHMCNFKISKITYSKSITTYDDSYFFQKCRNMLKSKNQALFTLRISSLDTNL